MFRTKSQQIPGKCFEYELLYSLLASHHKKRARLQSLFSVDMFNREVAVTFVLHFIFLGFISVSTYLHVPDSENIVGHSCMIIIQTHRTHYAVIQNVPWPLCVVQQASALYSSYSIEVYSF